MQREPIETDGIYHIYNRGVDKRITFDDDDEYRYFIHFLYTLNDSKNTSTNIRRDFLSITKSNNYQTATNEEGSTFFISNPNNYKRDMLVDIYAFVLMPNHYHLLLKQKVDNGVSKFMQKLGTGYTMMFNEKHERSGSLFQGRYKSKHILSDEQLRYITHYIHLNPLGKNNLLNLEESVEYLKKYKWSSFPDYVEIKNFPSVTSRDFIFSLFEDKNKYLKSISSVLEKNDLLSHVDSKDCIDYSDS